VPQNTWVPLSGMKHMWRRNRRTPHRSRGFGLYMLRTDFSRWWFGVGGAALAVGLRDLGVLCGLIGVVGTADTEFDAGVPGDLVAAARLAGPPIGGSDLGCGDAWWSTLSQFTPTVVAVFPSHPITPGRWPTRSVSSSIVPGSSGLWRILVGTSVHRIASGRPGRSRGRVLVLLCVMGVTCRRPTHVIVVVIPAASLALEASFIRRRGQWPVAALGTCILVYRLTVGTEPHRGAHAKVVFVACPAPRHRHFLPGIPLGSSSACRGSARWRAGIDGVIPIMPLVRSADNTPAAVRSQPERGQYSVPAFSGPR